MDLLDAIILGIIQGLTEFLPVSSSGHIELGKAVLGTQLGSEDENILFTIVVHFATALSTIIVFRKDIMELLKGLLSTKWNEEKQFSFHILLSMIPVGIAGLFFKDYIDHLFEGNIVLVGFMLIVTGLLLFLAGRARNTNKKISWKDAIIIGISQLIAILPGISRSGATISTSVILGNDRARAARFSFLMVIPVIFGIIAKDSYDILSGEKSLGTVSELPLIAGFIAAFIVGLIACTWMIRIVKKAKLHYFSYYCFIVGIVAIIAGVV